MQNNDSFENDRIAQELVEYYADPSDQRTLQKVAEDLQVDYVTLYRHKKQYKKQILEVADKKRKDYMSELKAKGYKALESKLTKSPKMLELLFKLTGELVERIEQTNKYESADVKRQKLGELLGKFGVKLIVDNTPSNQTQLPQVESKPSQPVAAPKLDKD